MHHFRNRLEIPPIALQNAILFLRRRTPGLHARLSLTDTHADHIAGLILVDIEAGRLRDGVILAVGTGRGVEGATAMAVIIAIWTVDNMGILAFGWGSWKGHGMANVDDVGGGGGDVRYGVRAWSGRGQNIYKKWQDRTIQGRRDIIQL